jgi:hypothetical protein
VVVGALVVGGVLGLFEGSTVGVVLGPKEGCTEGL